MLFFSKNDSTFQGYLYLLPSQIFYNWSKSRNFFIFRSSHQRFCIKKIILKTFTKFTGKHQCQSLFLNKFAGLMTPATLLMKRQACNFIRKEIPTQVFSFEFCKIVGNTFFAEHLRKAASWYSANIKIRSNLPRVPLLGLRNVILKKNGNHVYIYCVYGKLTYFLQ